MKDSSVFIPKPTKVTFVATIGNTDIALILDRDLDATFNQLRQIESGLARPYHGYHRRIHQKAAALAHAMVSNHGFGRKSRSEKSTGSAACKRRVQTR